MHLSGQQRFCWLSSKHAVCDTFSLEQRQRAARNVLRWPAWCWLSECPPGIHPQAQGLQTRGHRGRVGLESLCELRMSSRAGAPSKTDTLMSMLDQLRTCRQRLYSRIGSSGSIHEERSQTLGGQGQEGARNVSRQPHYTQPRCSVATVGALAAARPICRVSKYTSWESYVRFCSGVSAASTESLWCSLTRAAATHAARARGAVNASRGAGPWLSVARLVHQPSHHRVHDR